MNNLADKQFGHIYLRCLDLQFMNEFDRYFICLNLIKPLLRSFCFTNSTPGFYISYHTNTKGFGPARLTYFTDNNEKTITSIRNFLSIHQSIEMDIEQQDEPGHLANEYLIENNDENEERFRNFLNIYTQIGLDLLEYDILYSRRLAAEYRLTYFPQRISARQLFESAFREHSNFFRILSETSVNQFWQDLDVWPHPPNLDWAHFLVSMLLPGDCQNISQFSSLFQNQNPKSPITGELKILFLDIFHLNNNI